MLDLGFLPDVERILQLTPAGRQTMLFSATMPGEIVTLARRHLSRPMHIRAEHHDEPQHVPTTEQHVFRAHQMDKVEVLARILQAEGRGLTIVFCRTKRSADQVATTLTTKGFAAAAVHGDLGQGQRERAMRAFRSGKVDVLVATDVAARGLDVDDVTHVINYECPEDEKAYLHRIGRTGRAGREGVAVTFVDWADLHRWKTINDTLHLDYPEPLETYSTSEHLYTALSIPAGAKGVLPRAQRERAGLEAEDARGHRRDRQDPLAQTGSARPAIATGDRDRSHRDAQARPGPARPRRRAARTAAATGLPADRETGRAPRLPRAGPQAGHPPTGAGKPGRLPRPARAGRQRDARRAEAAEPAADGPAGRAVRGRAGGGRRADRGVAQSAGPGRPRPVARRSPGVHRPATGKTGTANMRRCPAGSRSAAWSW